MPAGLEPVSFFSRICKPGLCEYRDVLTGRVTLADCFEMALMVDWQEHCGAVAEERAREQNSR